MQAKKRYGEFRYLIGKKVPAKPPPDDYYGDSGVPIMHYSRDQITEWRNEVGPKTPEQPKDNAGHDYAEVLPLRDREIHFFLQT